MKEIAKKIKVLIKRGYDILRCKKIVAGFFILCVAVLTEGCFEERSKESNDIETKQQELLKLPEGHEAFELTLSDFFLPLLSNEQNEQAAQKSIQDIRIVAYYKPMVKIPGVTHKKETRRESTCLVGVTCLPLLGRKTSHEVEVVEEIKVKIIKYDVANKKLTFILPLETKEFFELNELFIELPLYETWRVAKFKRPKESWQKRQESLPIFISLKLNPMTEKEAASTYAPKLAQHDKNTFKVLAYAQGFEDILLGATIKLSQLDANAEPLAQPIIATHSRMQDSPTFSREERSAIILETLGKHRGGGIAVDVLASVPNKHQMSEFSATYFNASEFEGIRFGGTLNYYRDSEYGQPYLSAQNRVFESWIEISGKLARVETTVYDGGNNPYFRCSFSYGIVFNENGTDSRFFNTSSKYASDRVDYLLKKDSIAPLLEFEKEMIIQQNKRKGQYGEELSGGGFALCQKSIDQAKQQLSAPVAELEQEYANYKELAKNANK